MKDFSSNDALLEMFLFETTQLLEQLELVILSSDSNACYSEEAINEVFRIMHTIKGSSAMMMYNEISTLSHTIEDIFYFIREENPQQNFCSALNDLILESIDFIKIELEKIKNHDDVDGNASELVDRLTDFLSGLKKNTSSLSANNHYKAIIFYEEGCEMENIRAYSLIKNLEEITKEVIYYPSDILDNDGSVEVIRSIGFHVYMKTDKTEEEIYKHLMQTVFLKKLELNKLDEEAFTIAIRDGIAITSSIISSEQKEYKETDLKVKDLDADRVNVEEDRLITEIDKSNSDKEQKQSAIEAQGGLSTQSIISVSVAKLDKLMDLVGEMVIAEAMVLQNPDLEGLELTNFHKAASQLSKITSEIQDMVMSVRMVPLSATFQRMNRIVRDMCRKLNKQIDLEIIGEETEVDKNIIERITDPLMHLVRNAIDHGIETADKRVTMGKPRKGRITLEAKNAGSEVHIIVKDDGKGLNNEKILKKARENNLVTTEVSDHMSDSEIYKLILMPGFSTNDRVTEFSGRGVGMDVVAKNIESIGGSILIDSKINEGTQFTLTIPLTLAIIDGMNLQVGQSTYTIPTNSIQESFSPKAGDIIIDPDGNEMIMVRGNCYPILRLHKFFNVKTEIEELTDGIITMVMQEGKNLCIFADSLIGQQQVVVKSLPEYITRYRKIRGISGCTLLGDGSISLILDIANLINSK